MQTEILDVKATHQTVHTRVQNDLSQIKGRLEELKDFQATLLAQNAVTSQELQRWQGEFQQTVRALCTCTKGQLELLLMNGREPVEIVRGSGINSLQAGTSALQIFASALASGFGTLTALSLFASNNPPIRTLSLHSQWRCCQDFHQVNPEYWGESCPGCAHERCCHCIEDPESD
jgi:hypothetical protein